ncbi:MAG: type IV pilus secretin PilQ [Gammaproteobacteria bacterium]|nr:MAG: type IV pilus secretin PilQ [Gammaproteobacteria bacterium]RKZ71538.1 MAG: type IV pilus secretin PilQ [Gammaproteobacteria bacterium]
MTKRISHIVTKFFSLVVLFAIAGFTATVQAATLDNISYSVLPGERVQLQIELSEPMEGEPLNFTIDNPARIALDFPNTQLGAVQKSQSIDVGVAHSVSAVEAAGRTRVVLNLVNSVPYEIDVQGSSVIVTLGVNDVIVADALRGGAPSSLLSTNNAGGTSSSIEGIDFRRGDDGEGRVIVTLSDPSISVDMNQVGGKIVLDFIGAALPGELDRKLDVVDFATPVKEIDTKGSNNGTRMMISTTAQQYDHLAYQSDNTFIVEVRPLSEQEQETRKEKAGFTGERLSLNFQDIEVRAVLQLIADFTGLNMVASDTVGGNVTLRLKNVPWDQALDIILKAKGLGMRQIDNVIMVAPNAEIAAREQLELESSRQVEELAPLYTEFIQVNYAKAGDLADLIKADENNLLSERGSVTIDVRTNTLIIQDITASLESIREMLAKLDIPIRQVLIESRIVNADENFAKDLGVRFGYAKNTKQGNAVTREDIGPNPRDPVAIFTGSEEGNVDGTGGTARDGIENLLVDLPALASGAGASLIVGKIGSYLLQLELTALVAEGRGEDIASPKVITSNQSTAIIESGVEIPYQEASSSGATTTAFKKAVLSLEVTPQITPDDRVLLDLSVSQDSPGLPVVGGIPINTRRVETQVLVDNGETVVLGGVYTRNETNAVERVPFFGDLPYVGFLFKRSSTSETKSELLIFVTPKILKESLKI